MFRNKEFKRLIAISVIAVLLELCLLFNMDRVIYNIGKGSKTIFIVLEMTLIVVYIMYIVAFTTARYKKIDTLSKWLFKLQGRDTDSIATYIEDLKRLTSHDEFKLDNYVEGELSILQSDIHKVTVRMIELNERLLKDKTYLADTLADMSHQLKTPMTSMMVMADLLNDGNLPADKREEFTKNIQNQLERMEWLLSTLLRMSKLDAGTLKLNPELADIENVLRKSVEHLLIPMELKNQTLTIKRSDIAEKDYDLQENGAEPLYVKLDVNWTVEAIANIVKNCMEHTPVDGRIDIAYGKNPLYDYIAIEDNGAGIVEEDLPHIFKRFYKGKNASKDSVGIGLAFAKQIINMENGSIDVTSTPNQGTKFLIKIYR